LETIISVAWKKGRRPREKSLGGGKKPGWLTPIGRFAIQGPW
jgi:hypothetical protein